MVFLQGHGVSTSHAVKIYKRTARQAIAVVRENPYRLASDIFGIGFLTADAIAKNSGVLPESPERCRAGVLTLLCGSRGRRARRGSSDDLIERNRALLEVDRDRAQRELTTARRNGRRGARQDAWRELGGLPRIALHRGEGRGRSNSL